MLLLLPLSFFKEGERCLQNVGRSMAEMSLSIKTKTDKSLRVSVLLCTLFCFSDFPKSCFLVCHLLHISFLYAKPTFVEKILNVWFHKRKV